tara:strand:+ start:534 stop:755 length:222 start_codon:yes stop_codon:yes gene_type:complete
MSDLEIIKILLEEMEDQNTHIRGRSGAGNPHFSKKGPKTVLGLSFMDEYFPENEEEKEDESFKPVEVSRAFKK